MCYKRKKWRKKKEQEKKEWKKKEIKRCLDMINESDFREFGNTCVLFHFNVD